ncbi:MAG: GGDEF domain-containing protein [Butyrivibrio sp.]|nr:GGDEF domain-containing protein [Butyrivibrio sp.]
MRIGLLVSEMQDDAVRKFCLGADAAAKKYDVNLCIFPGKYIPGNITNDANHKFDYQNQAIFDYISANEFDVLIVDIGKIGRNTTILRKYELLNSFTEIPVLTLSEEEGFVNVNLYEEANCEQQGFLAVHDAIYYVNHKEIPEKKELSQILIPNINLSNNNFHTLFSTGAELLRADCENEDIYEKIVQHCNINEVENAGIFLFDTEIINTAKKKWNIPENITAKILIQRGNLVKKDEQVKTFEIFKELEDKKYKTIISKIIYVADKQIGIMLMEFSQTYSIINYEIAADILMGSIRIYEIQKKLERTEKELEQSKEELARDGSVLDHIGDTDYLTGLLNRRGFFDKAYDALKKRFKPSTYVVVAYIDMDSIKNINQMFGHDEGDRAVKRVAQVITEVFGNVSIYGRIRGDEFAVLHVTEDEYKAEEFKQKMSEQNARLMTETGRYLNHLQFSICEFSYEDNLSLRDMLKETDENLKKMKHIEINK